MKYSFKFGFQRLALRIFRGKNRLISLGIVLLSVVLIVYFIYKFLSTCESDTNYANGDLEGVKNFTRLLKNDSYVVPNIVHFLWFTSGTAPPRDLLFINYVSILSAHQVQIPDFIILHYNVHLPSGKWWTELLRKVPYIKTVQRKEPTCIFGKRVTKIYHQADLAKFEIILEYGGIYLDYDVFVIKSLNPLRKYNATMGKEKPPKLIAGIIIGAPGAEFYQMTYDGYRDYRPDEWDYNCAVLPFEISLLHPELVHVEERSLTTPDYKERHLLWRELIEWRHLYVVHAMTHMDEPEQFTPESVARLNTTFGEIVRHIYYGSSELRDNPDKLSKE